MAEEDKIEVGFGGNKVAASGRGVSRIADSLADLISPFSQGLGLAGDHIRIFRERSVAAVLAGAKDLAEQRGEEIRPANLKNLVPILENASLESPESELIEMWSRLLLSGDDVFDPELAMFTDVLKRISPKEASFLKGVFDVCDKHDGLIFPDIIDRNNRDSIPYLFREVLDVREDLYFESVRSLFSRGNLLFGRMLYIGGLNEKSARFTCITPEFSKNSTSINILSFEKLIEVKHVRFDEGEYELSITYCEITPIGLRLIERCYPG